MSEDTRTSAAPDARAWSYDELVREGLSLIPAHAPQWTDHNPSDPGITLVELLAYLSEILAYRAARVSPDARLNLLRLLEGPRWTGWRELFGQPAAAIDDAIRGRVSALSQSRCAVTPEDHEWLAIDAAREWPDGGERVYAMCVPGAVVTGAGPPDTPDDGDGELCVFVAPERALDAARLRSLCQHVQREIEPHCLLGSSVRVLPPVYLHLWVGCRLAPGAGISAQAAVQAVDAALRRHFDPATASEAPGGASPFGRAVHLSEVAAVIDRCDEIDYVEDIQLRRIGEHPRSDDDIGARIGLRIGVYSTIALDTRLGSTPALPVAHLLRDDSGEVVSVLPKPWVLTRVSLAREAVATIGDGGGR
jgi:hypothetical protein